MVMRQRTSTGPTTGRLRPVLSQNYQYFTPTYEWKQEEGCAVLVVHLPGFTKEQIGVQLQSMDKLRVRGTRPARGNTFIRFDQTYPIPEDCTTTGLQANFEGGFLRVTFQKKKKKPDDAMPVVSEEMQSKPTQPAPKPIEEVNDSTPPPKPSPTIRPAEQLREEEALPAASTAGGGDGKPVEAAPSSKVKSQIDEENDGRQLISSITEANATSTEAPTKLKSPPDDDEETNLGKASVPKTTTEALSSGKALSNKPETEKVSEGQREDDIVEKATEGEEIGKVEKALDQKQTETGGKMSKESESMAESSAAATAAANASENAPERKQTEEGDRRGEKIDKDQSNLTAENDTDHKRIEKENIDEPANSLDEKGTNIGSTIKNGVEGYTYEKYKQIVKEFITPKDEEERKLLVNIGVAALIIVALGTYITYSRWSSAKRQ